jgi:hypothetical protein
VRLPSRLDTDLLSEAICNSLSVAEGVRAEQIDCLRAPSQSARSKLLPTPIDRLSGRREEGARDNEGQPNRLRLLFKPRRDVDGVA